jgi:predicted RNA binding protein YcfA (HicA-like mRNA interferase family)
VSKLPQVSGDRIVRALSRLGFHEIHRKGSHVMLAHRRDPSRVAVVPVHKGRAVPAGTLRAILKGAAVSPEELREAL